MGSTRRLGIFVLELENRSGGLSRRHSPRDALFLGRKKPRQKKRLSDHMTSWSLSKTKQELLASCDVIISKHICGLKLQRFFAH